MTDNNCIMCRTSKAEKKMTWVNSEGSGIGGGVQGGNMCYSCMEFMNDALSRFPVAQETITLWPVGTEEV